MERIRTLINKLQQQSEQKASAAEMLSTVKLLEAELTAASLPAEKKSGSKVSVVLPAAQAMERTIEKTEENKIYSKELKPAENNMLQDRANFKKQEQGGWLFDPVEEIPTLAHQKQFKELNDVIGHYGVSLNDTLKQDNTELVSRLKESPVRDLKKAIGVNDRFVFLNELFRGDEAMYERSIKTINNFKIYPEAEYWIERELKVKIGWDENKPSVKHFCQLVKRRFS